VAADLQDLVQDRLLAGDAGDRPEHGRDGTRRLGGGASLAASGWGSR
jgi:hypothetical protein